MFNQALRENLFAQWFIYKVQNVIYVWSYLFITCLPLKLFNILCQYVETSKFMNFKKTLKMLVTLNVTPQNRKIVYLIVLKTLHFFIRGSYSLPNYSLPNFEHIYERKYQIPEAAPTFPARSRRREMSGKVGKCREMSGNVGKCRENVGKCREMSAQLLGGGT